MRVLVFGDSITQGFWDLDGGWVARLRRTYDKQMIDGVNDDPPTLFNLGVSGDSSDDIVARFDSEAKARKNSENLAIVFAVGVNDSRTKADTEFSNTERYQDNLNQLWLSAKQLTDKLLFVGLTPCVESRTTPVRWGDTGYTNDRIQAFDKTLKDFCEQNNLAFVEVFETFQTKQQTTELLPDGLHPNKAGHQLIADIVGPKIAELVQ